MLRTIILIFLMQLLVPKAYGQVLDDAVDSGGIYGEPAYDYMSRVDMYKFEVYGMHRKEGLMDQDHNVVIPAEYDGVAELGNGLLFVRKDDKEGLFNESGKTIVPPIYDDVQYNHDGVIVVENGNKYGLYSYSGQLLLPCEFDSVVPLSKGVNAGRFHGLWALVGNDNQYRTTFKYSQIACSDSAGYLKAADDRGRWGLIDTGGHIILPCIYKNLWGLAQGYIIGTVNSERLFVSLSSKKELKGGFAKALEFHEGLAGVRNAEGKWGYIDTNGIVVVPYKYSEAGNFLHDRAVVTLGKFNCLIDTRGKCLARFKHKRLYLLGNGFVWVKGRDNKMGLINNSGERILTNKYQYISMEIWNGLIRGTKKFGGYNSSVEILDTFGRRVNKKPYAYAQEYKAGEADLGEGLMPVARVRKDAKKGKGFYGPDDMLWGYMNLQGEEVIPCQFDEAWPFEHGFAKVSLHGMVQRINKRGRVVPLPFKGNEWDFVGTFSGWRARVQDKRGYWGFIDQGGSLQVPCRYEDAQDFYEGLAAVMQNGKWGYITKEGFGRIGCQFEMADKFIQGIALVRDSSGFRFVRKNGRFINEHSYTHAEAFSEGVALVEWNERAYFVDTWGKEKEAFCKDYLSACSFHDSLACVHEDTVIKCYDHQGVCRLSYNEGYLDFGHYLDAKGYVFTNGLMKVRDGFIDQTGRLAVKSRWDQAKGFQNGFAVVGIDDQHPMRDHGDWPTCKYGLIDTTGRLVTPVKFDYIGSFSSGLAPVLLNGKYGYIDTSGRLVIKNIYKRANTFSSVSSGSVAAVLLKDQWLLINTSGEVVRGLGLVNMKEAEGGGGKVGRGKWKY